MESSSCPRGEERENPRTLPLLTLSVQTPIASLCNSSLKTLGGRLMAESRVFTGSVKRPRCPEAGIIKKVRVENFMCHSNLEIELGQFVNFITGQNGSGKSAILTALSIAFGCRAKGTQRANTMKDFIKNGCRFGICFLENFNP
ncbi:hypothetical protein M9H77_10587 [Catharanthus roseus]|uniref:Uncharacterized protein n=1 Tax=Catharanthus roseus TaxID=4058 RepID=A0ACC0BCE2_CATRO|nr:hypothetical protein M9H77_10587 [Catharanthus roseus]